MSTFASTRTRRAWSPEQIADLSGRTAVVTGASSGLGLQITSVLARSGATVVMAVRNPDEAGGARRELARAGVPAERLEVSRLDLIDLDGVRRFAAHLADRLDRLDLLVLNAGISSQPHSVSPQGVESQLAVNHLGHFALTGLVLDLLSAGTDARVVIGPAQRGRGVQTSPVTGPARDTALASALWTRSEQASGVAYLTSRAT